MDMNDKVFDLDALNAISIDGINLAELV
jgi:hypothetical protein